ncbi:MAG: hypothetical protein ACHQ0J_00170 [Candidatus Dormibacterales bacterium]
MDEPAAGRGAAWAFFIASALAAAGGILPTLFASTSGRISSVIVPFWLGALCFAATGAFRRLGRTLVTVGYLAGGLAIVFGMLGMFAVLVQLTVLTTCPPGTAACGLGFTRPLTPAETTGIGYAMGMGTVALVAGFAGLRAVYRQRGRQAASFSAPVRRIAPAGPPPQKDVPGAGVTGPGGSEEGD